MSIAVEESTKLHAPLVTFVYTVSLQELKLSRKREDVNRISGALP
jgi:hypothetical protein